MLRVQSISSASDLLLLRFGVLSRSIEPEKLTRSSPILAGVL